MMRSIKSWFTPEARASESQNYTSALLAAQLAAARGDYGSIRDPMLAYRGSLTLIGHAAGVATLGRANTRAALQPHLSTIARSMVDTGESLPG